MNWIQVETEGGVTAFRPGDVIAGRARWQLGEAPEEAELRLFWYTEGKGDEDLSVHYFERRTPTDADDGDLRPLRRFRTRLPNSPLSYRGAILNVCWCVRVRVFLQRGKDVSADHHFQLGSVPAAAARSARPGQ
jgi:hypothetical protein